MKEGMKEGRKEFIVSLQRAMAANTNVTHHWE
jgi:hypothetical protein